MQTTAKDEDLTASTPTLECRPYYSNYVNDYYVHDSNSMASKQFVKVSKQIAHNKVQLEASNNSSPVTVRFQPSGSVAEKQASPSCFINCWQWCRGTGKYDMYE
jgi:hypothetical protein